MVPLSLLTIFLHTQLDERSPAFPSTFIIIFVIFTVNFHSFGLCLPLFLIGDSSPQLLLLVQGGSNNH